MSSGHKSVVTIAVEGCCHGALDNIYESVKVWSPAVSYHCILPTVVSSSNEKFQQGSTMFMCACSLWDFEPMHNG